VESKSAELARIVAMEKERHTNGELPEDVAAIVAQVESTLMELKTIITEQVNTKFCKEKNLDYPTQTILINFLLIIKFDCQNFMSKQIITTIFLCFVDKYK
jgi:hypothetical protein